MFFNFKPFKAGMSTYIYFIFLGIAVFAGYRFKVKNILVDDYVVAQFLTCAADNAKIQT